MKPFVLFCILLGIVDAGPDTPGCAATKPNRFLSLSFTTTNSMSLVFCSSFAEDSGLCGDNEQLVANDDGFYERTNYPCKYFNGETSSVGKSVIAFFSGVTIESKMYFYPQTTDKTGLFLTKNFKTKVANNVGSKLGALVEAVVPKHSHTDDVAAHVTPTCHDPDNEDEIIDHEGSIADKEGKVYCKFTAQCSDLKRDASGCSELVVRTTTAEFADTDGVEIIVNNDFLFLTKGESKQQIVCEATGDDNTFEWYLNGEPQEGTEKIYEHVHNGVDTIIQCQVSKDGVITATTIWNIFTVADVGEVESTAGDIDVTNGESKTFDCDAAPDAVNFPSPLGIWYWLADGADGAEEQLKEVTVANTPKFPYEQSITYSDFGNFKCYLFNGIGQKSLAKDYKTVYIVETKVEYLIPTPKYWYEYNVITSVPEVYYVKKDTVKLSCSITKEAKYDIWWKLGEEYFHLQENDDDEVLKKLDPSAALENLIENSMITEDRNGWTIAKQDVSETLGHQTKQDFAIEDYKSDMVDDTETIVPAICILADTKSITTVAQLKGIIETGETDQKIFKKLTIRVFEHITKPVVKGPLNQIQSEKLAKDMILNCKTNGLPPAFIYFMFSNNKTEGINITEELLKEEKVVQFTRYRIERTTDMLTTLTIQAPNEDDEGKFTCYAINRQTKEDAPVAGPDADVYIEEPCSEGAQFCFKNVAIPKINYLWVLVLATMVYEH